MFDSDFVEESLEFIEESEALLLSMEGSLDLSDISTTLAPFMRCLHSLKGASSMYGLTEIVDYTHHLEQKVIKEIPVLNNEHIAFYLQELDKLRHVFEYQDVNYLTVSKESVSSPQPKKETKQQKKTDIVPVTAEGSEESKVVAEKKEFPVEIDSKSLIAFIDDEEMIHEIFVEGCRDENWEVKSFFDPTKIDDFAAYDLLVIDYMMPGMNGLELIEKIRSLESKVPIILLSGFVTKELCLNAFKFEHVIVVEKLASIDLLIISAKQQIEKYHAYKLLGKSLDLIKFHFGDLHVFLKSQGFEKLSESIGRDIQILERERKKLKI